ncbi:glucose PTS transporter subunit IIA [Amedibacillus dolichus]|uniref:Glucose PTS transporter subunit IIA n=1 Tax=Amedibacillus dolichus TaxID=31971 RepID=A0ABT7U9W5_9FIRM|nr:glucose PTS transporter subunit IIA [Amedibacillus dolichus]MDM8156426.1 glucose PTS transporter subunit IIA [Amedibacillus dolichus]
MRKYEHLVKTIIYNVGGKKNITDVTHCLTRLRFRLADEDRINEDNILNCDEVLTAQKVQGEYQVVVGVIVNEVFAELEQQLGGRGHAQEESEEVSGNLLMRAIKTITKCITPVLGVMSATALLQGLNALLNAMGLLNGGTAVVLTTLANTVLRFLPIFIGFTAAKHFRMKNAYIGLLMGAAMCFPDLEASLMGAQAAPLYTMFAGTMFETPVYSTFLGLPILFPAGGYYSTVIPVIVAVWFAAKVEHLLSRYIPDILGFCVTPALTVLVAYPATLLALGPISNFGGLLIQNLILWLFGLSPLVCHIFICLIYQPLVILGMHWPLAPIQLTNIATMGYDPVLVCMWPSAFSVAGAAAGVYFKTKNSRMKQIAGPAVISGLCHIMEPALYGITLPDKKRQAFAILGATLAGIIISVTGIQNYTLSGTILGVTGFINPTTGDLSGLFWILIACAVSFGVPMVLCYLSYQDEKQPKKQTEESSSTGSRQRLQIASPLQGEIMELSESADAAFAQEKMGKGVAIRPTSGEICAPFDGTLTMVFPTKHAIGLKSEEGIELLIHIGIDTVHLQGECFTLFKQSGDPIRKGERIGCFDLEEIRKRGYDPQSFVIVTNAGEYLDVLSSSAAKDCSFNAPLLTVLPSLKAAV